MDQVEEMFVRYKNTKLVSTRIMVIFKSFGLGYLVYE